MHTLNVHCQGCRCSLKQNMPRLLMTAQQDALHDKDPWISAGQTGYRNSHDETEGHWFGGASVLNISDANGCSSVGQGVHGALSCENSFSSSGSLVCSSDAMSASPSGGLLGRLHGDYRLPYDNHLVYPGHCGGTNQALTRDVQQNADVYQGLANYYSSTFPPFALQSQYTNTIPGAGWSTNAIAPEPIINDISSSPLAYNLASSPLFSDPRLGATSPTEDTWLLWNTDPNRFKMDELGDGATKVAISEPLSNTQSNSFADIGDIDWERLPAIAIQSPSSKMAIPDTAAATEIMPISDNPPENVHAPPEKAPESSLSSFNTEADGHSPNSRGSSGSRTPGLIKVFPCLHEGCDYTAPNRRDLMRHLRTKKHSRRSAMDDVEIPVPQQTFRCSHAACNYASQRRDNWIRHIWKVHKVRVERQQPGRRPSGRRLGPSSPQRGRSP